MAGKVADVPFVGLHCASLVVDAAGAASTAMCWRLPCCFVTPAEEGRTLFVVEHACCVRSVRYRLHHYANVIIVSVKSQ